MKLPVTSVSKREQKLGDVASAISVLTNDDLRRSGATTVVDALRMVPGANIAQANAVSQAVSVRGFGNVFANKLLVLVDGRAVYTPLFAGVFWDLQRLMLEDVDRIEVIRGPGATVWGANAVNGVINIVTRSAKETQGGLLYASAGDVKRTSDGARYGGRGGENTYYRVFADYDKIADSPLEDGRPAGDGWLSWQSGVRVDHYPQAGTHLTWQADVTDNKLYAAGWNTYNANTLGRWTRELSDHSSYEVQAYYDRTYRNDPTTEGLRIDTLDIAAQQTIVLKERHDVIWGLGYRSIANQFEQTSPFIMIRDHVFNQQVFNLFVQDEFKLIPDRLLLTAGAKLEHNDFTGVEIQPSIRAVLKLAPNQTIWAAVSRALRTPDEQESHDALGLLAGAPFIGPGGTLYLPIVVGNPDVKAEVLKAYELGFRTQLAPKVSVDLTAFYNRYTGLTDTTFQPVRFVPSPFPGFPGVAELVGENLQDGHTSGAEISVVATPTDDWRLTAGYSLMRESLPESNNPMLFPQQQATLRSSWDVSRRAAFDAQLRYVDSEPGVPSYLTADARLGFHPTSALEVALVGQNLFDRRRPEFASAPFVVVAQVPRGVYGKLTWRRDWK
jgi:iron complex outermembrane receptor protein